ncbi:hypothetical protein [Bradyrhizobium sp. UFLA03-84]|uniref:hypothetical protein n=1 Tax=Bradyrhizobium sp. UFLA03-84 TaxID=418599 RepID=UPI001FD9590B|nr:hypothetical protein [Bradyrhizobium sp. UFLA03-84]
MPDQVGADLAEEWMAEGLVLLNYGKHVATLTLNRPEAFNGMNIGLMCHCMKQ